MPFRLGFGTLIFTLGIALHPLKLNQVGLWMGCLLCIVLTLVLLKVSRLSLSSFWLFSAFASLFWLGNARYQMVQVEAVEFSKSWEGVFQVEGRWSRTSHGFKNTVRSLSEDGLRYVLYTSQDVDTTLETNGVIRVNGGVQPFDSACFPYQFDAKGFYERRGYSGSIYADHIQVLDRGERSVRDQCADFILSSPLDKRVSGFYIAMLLGDKSELSLTDKQSFADAGIVHVLAVSGLHVGLIFVAIQFLIGKIVDRKKWPWSTFLLVVSALWYYAYLTGFGPSVLRATLMFSLLEAARIRQRSNMSGEAIWMAAFILLFIRPLDLFELGFQLSYTAVLAIVYGHNRLQKRWSKLVRWKRYLLNALSVSLWAQMATTPITLFYFHRFPLYFLLTNLIFLPFVPLVVGVGVLAFFLEFIWTCPDVIWWLVNSIVNLFIEAVSLTSALPNAVLDGVFIPQRLVWLVGAVLVFFTLSLYHRKWILWWVTAGTALFTLGISIMNQPNLGPWMHEYNGAKVWEAHDGNVAQIIVPHNVNAERFLRESELWRQSCGVDSVRILQVENTKRMDSLVLQ